MSLVSRLLPYIIILAVVTMVPDVSLADMGLVIQMFDVEAGTEPVTVKAGPADLVMTITARNACDKIYISVAKIDNMSYTGPKMMEATVGPTLTAAFRVPIIIAANDTCGLEFEITGGSAKEIAKAYWVSSSDTTKFYIDNPRLYPVLVERRLPIGPMPKKPVRERQTTLVHANTTIEEMHALEQEPLTEFDREIFNLDGEVWFRYKGEKEFHRGEAISTEDVIRLDDSLQAKYGATNHDVVLDLRDSALHAIAQSMVESLTPMDTPGYYRTTASGALLKQLRARGIYDAPYPQFPRDRTKPRKCGEIDSLTQLDK